ncbi:MAG: hypothetical protein ACR2QH_19780 [Geminicoccaceae bacterium]
MLSIASGGGIVLAAMVSWTTLDLPRPVLTTDLRLITDNVADNQAFMRDSRLMILNGDWWRYEARLGDVREQIKTKPHNPYLQELERRLRREQAAIQQQIDRMK